MSSIPEYMVETNDSVLHMEAQTANDNAAFDNWVRRNVIPAFNAYKEHPENVFTADEIRAHLALAGAQRK